MADNRYQFQPWLIRAMRWLRWKPWYSILAVIDIIRWILAGARPMEVHLTTFDFAYTRWETLLILWERRQACAAMAMGNYMTGPEVLEELRSRSRRVET